MVSSDGSHQKFIPKISFPIWWVLSFKSPKSPYHFSNGCPVKVMVLAATNRPWDLDEALRRWGCSNRKNMGWIPDGCFFGHQSSKLMDMMDMIWYDLQKLPWCTRIHIFSIFLRPDVGMVVKSILSGILFCWFFGGLHKTMIHFLTGWSFLMRASGDSPFLRWDNLDKMMVFAAWVVT